MEKQERKMAIRIETTNRNTRKKARKEGRSKKNR